LRAPRPWRAAAAESGRRATSREVSGAVAAAAAVSAAAAAAARRGGAGGRVGEGMDDFDSGGRSRDKAGAGAGDDGGAPPLPQTVSSKYLQGSPDVI